MGLVAYSGDGSLDIRGTVNAYESAYGSVSDAVTRGQNKASIIESVHLEGDAGAIAAAGLWVLQNVPMPEVMQRVTNVALNIEGGAAMGASVGALFGGVGAIFGAAVGAVIELFQSFLGHSPPPPPHADSFDLLRQVVPFAEGGTVFNSSRENAQTGVDPLGQPIATILGGQVSTILGAGVTQGAPAFGLEHMMVVSHALGGDNARARKILDAFQLLHPLMQYGDKVTMRGKFDLAWGDMMRADSIANGGGVVPDLLIEAAIAALYTQLPDGKGHLWTPRDWYQYLMLVRRAWEYTTTGQRAGNAPGTDLKPNWRALSVVAGYASGLPGVVPSALEQSNAQRRSLAKLPFAVQAVLKAEKLGVHVLPENLRGWVTYYLG